MDFKTHNKLIACKPFETIAVEIEKKGNFAFAKQKIELRDTSVIYPYITDQLTLPVGTKIYLDGEIVKVHPWAKRVYRIAEESFILIPEQFVLVYNK